jgi:arginyl-tRNA synthetase
VSAVLPAAVDELSTLVARWLSLRRDSDATFKASVLYNGNRKFPHHYQCADALGLLGKLKAAGTPVTPQAAAERIVAAAPASVLVGKLEVVRNGFINIYLDNRCDCVAASRACAPVVPSSLV